MNNLKESFTIMKAITTRKTTLKMTILCHAIHISHIIKLLLTSTAWSLRENIRPRSFMYGPCLTG